MSFWTDKAVEPKRSYRFRLKSINGLTIHDAKSIPWWNAKKVDKPSYTVSTNKYRLINHEINVPGIISWNPINIEIVDMGGVIKDLLAQLGSFGYSPTQAKLGLDTGLSKATAMDKIGNLTIEQLDGDGKPLDVWKLEGAMITEVRFGNLDYTSDEIISLTLVVTYDYAYIEETEIK